LHVDQLAEALGLPPPAANGGVEAAHDVLAILDSWLRCIEDVDRDAFHSVTPSQGRELRELTVIVFRPCELLVEAWETGVYTWAPLWDRPVWEALDTAEEVRAYCRERRRIWAEFLAAEPPLDERDPLVENPRGRLPFSALL